MQLAVFGVQVAAFLIENHSMLDAGCLILEKSFTAEDAENADFGKLGFLALYRQMWDIIRKQYNQLLGAFMDNFSKY